MHRQAAPHIFVNAHNLRRERTPAEIALWEALREKRLDGFRFRQQHPIDNYILDFYCHSARLAVELDGAYHFTEEQRRLDEERTVRLSVLNLKVIRFTNDMVLHHLATVLSDIWQALIEETYTQPPTPEGSYNDYRDIYDDYHDIHDDSYDVYNDYRDIYDDYHDIHDDSYDVYNDYPHKD